MPGPLLGNDGTLDAEAEEWIREKGGSYILDPLLPYLAVRVLAGPPGRDEWPAYCPLHADARPSMNINFAKGVFYCHAGCGGGSIEDLIAARSMWLPRNEHPRFRSSPPRCGDPRGR
ncbi:MAG: CHC2 zinc finger domain-containing protein [Solirubrobacterales bacterium]